MVVMEVPELKAFAAYAERLIRFLGIWEVNGWRLKVYGISATRGLHDPETVSSEMIDSGRRIAEKVFTRNPTTNSYALGYVIFHEGRLANWLLLDWWADEIQVRHQLFKSPSADPAAFERVTSDLVACIWELRVIGFEREAWIEAMLKSPRRPDVRRYLDSRLLDGMF
jgi:hypothetical protein